MELSCEYSVSCCCDFGRLSGVTALRGSVVLPSGSTGLQEYSRASAVAGLCFESEGNARCEGSSFMSDVQKVVAKQEPGPTKHEAFQKHLLQRAAGERREGRRDGNRESAWLFARDRSICALKQARPLTAPPFTGDAVQ